MTFSNRRDFLTSLILISPIHFSRRRLLQLTQHMKLILYFLPQMHTIFLPLSFIYLFIFAYKAFNATKNIAIGWVVVYKLILFMLLENNQILILISPTNFRSVVVVVYTRLTFSAAFIVLLFWFLVHFLWEMTIYVDIWCSFL